MAVTSTTIKPRAPFWRRVPLTSLLTASTSILALLALLVLAQHGGAWAQARVDDLRYGNPRTVHLAGAVGGGDSETFPTRFVGLNLDGQISILIVPAGDPGRISVVQGPYVIGQDGPAAVPLLTLDDLTGDGAPDLLLTVRGETVVYVNHEGQFTPLTPAERARLEPVGGS